MIKFQTKFYVNQKNDNVSIWISKPNIYKIYLKLFKIGWLKIIMINKGYSDALIFKYCIITPLSIFKIFILSREIK